MKFGVREICNVVFKATANGQKIGTETFNQYQPVFMIDTATTSELSQESTTVYAQGGRGNNRLIAWEGEKTMTFTVTDALISPMGLAVLSGAGLIKPTLEKGTHVHCAIQKTCTLADELEISLEDLQEETGLYTATSFIVCGTIANYATLVDGSGAGIDWIQGVTVDGSGDVTVNNSTKAKFKTQSTATKRFEANKTYVVDFYLIMNTGVTEVEIKPEDFGGFFYVEAQTLFRREDNGQDMAAEIILPRVKVQSGFTFSMASSGDPSTFDFTMDAFPAYTQFDKTKKVCATFQILGTDASVGAQAAGHTYESHPSSSKTSATPVIG